MLSWVVCGSLQKLRQDLLLQGESVLRQAVRTTSELSVPGQNQQANIHITFLLLPVINKVCTTTPTLPLLHQNFYPVICYTLVLNCYCNCQRIMGPGINQSTLRLLRTCHEILGDIRARTRTEQPREMESQQIQSDLYSQIQPVQREFYS